MREIKFRGKRLDNNEWAYGSYLHQYFSTKNQKLIDAIAYTEGNQTFRPPIDPKTVGQFIGELDKNKNEIYEGDTIINPYQIAEDDPAHGVYEEKYIVKFINGMFTLQEENDGDFVDSLPDWNNLMVIENPELLEEEK